THAPPSVPSALIVAPVREIFSMTLPYCMAIARGRVLPTLVESTTYVVSIPRHFVVRGRTRAREAPATIFRGWLAGGRASSSCCAGCWGEGGESWPPRPPLR